MKTELQLENKLKPIRKHRKIVAVLCVIILVIGVFFWQTSTAQQHSQEIWGMADVKEEDVHAKVSGRVMEIYVEEGDFVEKGQVLARLDKDTQLTERTQVEASLRAQYAQVQQAIINSQTDEGTLNAALQSAQAQVRQAQSALNLAVKEEARYRQLLSQSAVSQQQYDSVKASLESAQAVYESALSGVASAQASLSKNAANQQTIDAQRQQLEVIQGQIDAVNISENETEIRAPFSGIITKKYIEDGSLVSSAVPLFSIQDTSDNWVEFNISEMQLSNYHVGDTVQLQGRNSDLKLSGKIENINRKADYAVIKATNERGDKDIISFGVKVRTNSEDVWPGMRFKLLD